LLGAPAGEELEVLDGLVEELGALEDVLLHVIDIDFRGVGGAEVDEALRIAVFDGCQDAVGELEIAVGDPDGGGGDEAREIILGGRGF